jgi:hypothetical protein
MCILTDQWLKCVLPVCGTTLNIDRTLLSFHLAANKEAFLVLFANATNCWRCLVLYGQGELFDSWVVLTTQTKLASIVMNSIGDGILSQLEGIQGGDTITLCGGFMRSCGLNCNSDTVAQITIVVVGRSCKRDGKGTFSLPRYISST